MKLKLILTVALILAASQFLSANDALIVQLRDAVRAGQNTRNLQQMQEARAKFERLLNISEKKWLVNHYIAWTDYQMAIFYFGKNDEDQAGKHLDAAIEYFNKSAEENEGFAETHALLSACYGMKIGISPMKAMFLGPKSGGAMSKAKEIEPNNPRVHLIDGIGAMNKPALFGGGTDKAKEALSLADSLFQVYQEPDSLYPNWGKVDPKIWLAQIAMKEKELKAARTYLTAALEQDPENNWIKYQLMPKLEEAEGEE